MKKFLAILILTFVCVACFSASPFDTEAWEVQKSIARYCEIMCYLQGLMFGAMLWMSSRLGG